MSMAVPELFSPIDYAPIFTPCVCRVNQNVPRIWLWQAGRAGMNFNRKNNRLRSIVNKESTRRDRKALWNRRLMAKKSKALSSAMVLCVERAEAFFVRAKPGE